MTKANIMLSVGAGALLLAIALGFVWLWSLSGASDSRAAADDLVARLMKRKSAAVANIRDGLDQGDYRQAERGVAELRRIGAASNWYLPDQRYSHLSGQFRQALDQLNDVLAARNTQQVRSTYTVLIESCQACHQQTSTSPLDAAQFLLRDSSSPR